MKIKKATCIKADISLSPLKDKQYDLIFSLMTLHHIPDIEKTINNLSQMLKPEGILCIADLDEDDGTYHANSHTEHNGINQEKLKKLFQKYDLHQTQSSTPYIIRYNPQGKRHNYPVFLIMGKKQK